MSRRKSPRVELRRPESKDVHAFLAMVGASRVLHRPWVYAPDSEEKFQRLVDHGAGGRTESFVVCRKTDGAIVGVINLSEIIRGALQSAFVGYYGAAGFEKQGYMTEGLDLVIRYAFRTLRLHRLEANIQPENIRSIKLAKRCGFRKEGFSPKYLRIAGRWRDHERWAMTAGEMRS